MSQLNVDKCIIIFTILNINLSKSQLSYDGPLALTSNYFQQELLHSSIDTSNLPELVCNSIEDSYDFTWWNWSFSGLNGTSYYLDATTTDSLVKYYKFNLTSLMKISYTSALSISTCCELDSCSYTNETKKEQCNNRELGHAFNDTKFNETMASYCTDDTALDTVLYILQEKKGKINIISIADDSSCGNSQHSYIDLSDYNDGEYIVAVGGYGTESGNFFLHLDCVKFLFPIEENQFDPPSDTPDITCGETLSGNVSTLNVEYFRFRITDTTWLPINITSSYMPYEYMIKKVTDDISGNDYKIIEFGDTPFCITDDNRDTYTNGEYYIVIQWPYGNEDFYVSINCGDPPTEQPTYDSTTSPSNSPSFSPTSAPTEPPKLNKNVMMGLVFGAMGLFFIILLSYYIYKCVKHHKNKSEREQSPDASHKYKAIASGNDEAHTADTSISIEMDALVDPEATMKPSIDPVKCQSNEDPDGGDELEELEETKSEEKDEMEVQSQRREEGGDVERKDDKDDVQRVLVRAIVCCQKREQLDIYQVLAIRYFHKESCETLSTGIKPLVYFGVDWEIIKLSPYASTLFMALIIFLHQIKAKNNGEIDYQLKMDL